MKHRIVIILCILLSSILASSQIRSGVAGSIAGTINTIQGEPVRDARVELHSEKTGELITSGYTNLHGIFEFSSVPNGTYEIIATSGLSEAREHIIVPSASNITLTIANATQSSDVAPDSATVSVAQYKVPGKARELFKKAQAAAHKHKLDEVDKYLAKALEIYPSFAEALTLRGIMRLDTSQVQPAIQDLEKAIQCDGNAAMSYLVLGAAYNMAKRFDDAIRVSDHGVALLPNAWQGYFEMAKSYIGKADYTRAIQQIDRAISLAPQDFAPVHLVKAHALLSVKSYSDAMSELQAFMERAPKDDPNAAQAMAMMNQVKAFMATAKK